MQKVNCEECNKEFSITPSRYKKNQHHTCSKLCLGKLSSRLHSKKIKTNCKICNLEIFYQKSHFKQIENPTCSRKCSGIMKHKMRTGNYSSKLLGLSVFERYFWDKTKDLNSRARVKKIAFDLDFTFLIELYKKQNGLCHYSKMPLMIYYKGNESIKYDTLSVDRVDSSKGYIKSNVVLCLNCINMMKAHHNFNDIKRVFKAIMIQENDDIKAKVKKLTLTAQLPTKADPLASGYDLFVDRYEDLGNYIKVYTGIAIQPESGYWFWLTPRSSIYKKGLTLYNNSGIIDQNYTGEIMAFFLKTSDFSGVSVGERLLQIIPQKIVRTTIIESETLSDTERGSGGFGSSGK